MASTYMLDTDICSYLIRSSDSVLQSHIQHVPAEKVVISVVTQAELLYGVKHFPMQHSRRTEVAFFLRLANILPWSNLAAEAYADIRHTLTTSGQLIGELDMMIAAHALARGSILVTNNTRHFERLAPPLHLENWAEST